MLACYRCSLSIRHPPLSRSYIEEHKMKTFSFALALLLLSASAFAGAWGEGSFENDDALDWVEQCVQSSGPSAVVTALEAALQSEMVDAANGAMAVAAAEVVAASRGKPSAKLPDNLRTWLEHQPKAEIAKFGPLARKAISHQQRGDFRA
jgi:hypothetical protein